MSGLGNSSVGFSAPFGVGEPDEVPAPPVNAPQAARFIDPVTRDYALAEDGSYLQMPELRQRVLLVVMETLGSSSVRPLDGVQSPTRIDATFERRMKTSLRGALRFLEREGSARIDSITIAYPRPGTIETTVAYTDLKTGTRDTATA